LAYTAAGLATKDQSSLLKTDDIFGVLVLVGVAVVALRGLPWDKLKKLNARSWPICQGRIEFGTVIEHRTRYFSYYSGQLSYSYSVSGEYYSGFHDKLFFRESSAERFIAELKGKPTFVRHKPSNPEVSTILREDQQSVWPLQM
jgi:hypothetical protein